MSQRFFTSEKALEEFRILAKKKGWTIEMEVKLFGSYEVHFTKKKKSD